jgi:DNA repair exonuclease SbcCD nuclease subunit
VRRFIQSSDWHITNDAQGAEQYRILQQIVDYGARLEQLDGWLIPGDLFHHNMPHRDPTSVELITLAAFAVAMGCWAPVIVCYGNHDTDGSLDLLRYLKTAHPIYVVKQPEVVRLPAANVVVIPYPQKAWLVASRGAGVIEEQRQISGRLLEQVTQQLVESVADEKAPTILMAHCNVHSSRVGGGERLLADHEIEFSPGFIDSLPIAFAALGHIHLPQTVGERAAYAGAPKHFDYGDVGQRGFFDIKLAGHTGNWSFERNQVPTSHRHRVTVNARVMTEEGHVGQWMVEQVGDGADLGHEVDVRVIAHVPEELRDVVDYTELEKLGRVEKRTIARVAVRCQEIVNAKTDEEQLRLYWSTLEPAPAATLQAEALAYHSAQQAGQVAAAAVG